MGKEVRLAMLATIASIFLNWVAPATVFADEPISVGSRVQPPNLQLAKAQSQPEQLHSDPASALGARLIQLPALGQASVKSQMTQENGGPTKIGFARDIPELTTQQNTQTQLEWKPVTGGMVGSLAISSPGAAALRMGIKIQTLPDAAELRFFSDRATEIQKVSGKTINDLIRLNIKAGDPEETARVYWSPVINGEIVGLEVFIPGGTSQDKVEISVPSVSHIEISPLSDLVKTQNFGDSGACNLDVMCNPNWQDTSNSVARMLYTSSGLSYWCTGTLLNDSGGTGTPYFLSANHCISSQSSASSLQTYWFYRSTACNSGVLNPNYQTLSQGASLLFNTATTDASFMKLNGTVPAGVVFSGWTTTPPALNQNTTGVHNPRGDIQKISYGSVASYQVCSSNSNNSFSCAPSTVQSGSFIQVNFSQGITEQGSSGSGIFYDGTKQLVGQLYGGNTSCANPTAPTYYGRFDKTYLLGNLGQWLSDSSLTYQLSYTPSTHNFGAVQIGSSPTQSFTINNTGTGRITFQAGYPLLNNTSSPYSYAIQSNSCGAGLSPNESCAMVIKFTPTVSGTYNAAIWSAINESSNNYTAGITASADNSVYSLGITKSGNGTVSSTSADISCGSTCSASFNSGSSVTLTATPASGYTFTGWTGDCSGTGACTLTMTSNKNVGASFALIPVYYSLNVSINGSGSLLSDPAGIFCSGSCSATYLSGTNVSLYPTAASGYYFTGWSGACSGLGSCTVNMTDNRSVTATFAVIPQTGFTLTVNKTGNGSISSLSPNASINCGINCQSNFAAGQLVTLFAQADRGHTFMGWSGQAAGLCGRQTSCDVYMSSNQSISGDFKNTYLLILPAIQLLLE